MHYCMCALSVMYNCNFFPFYGDKVLKIHGETFNKRESMPFGFMCKSLCEKFHSGTMQFRIFGNDCSNNSSI